MTPKPKLAQAQNPLILRCHRLMEAFAKSDDERDFYLDRSEGFILYVDLDKSEEDLKKLEKELASHEEKYVAIPKMTFYETKKIMEGFVNEKVYDIDTKEKLLEIIQSKEARENFLEFIFDHHSELEKWQQFYQERSRIRIIEWLRQNHFEFVFEEDLDLPKDIMEKLKTQLFESRVGKDVLAARKALFAKAKTYYSNEALNPRPKRGRPPKQVAKTEVEPQMTSDLYTTVPPAARPFLFLSDYSHGTFIIFSQKFENEEQIMARKKSVAHDDFGVNIESLNQKLNAIRSLSTRWAEEEQAVKQGTNPVQLKQKAAWEESMEEEDLDIDLDALDEDLIEPPKKSVQKKIATKAAAKAIPAKKVKPAAATAKTTPAAKAAPAAKPAPVKKAKPPVKAKPIAKTAPKPKPKAKATPKAKPVAKPKVAAKKKK